MRPQDECRLCGSGSGSVALALALALVLVLVVVLVLWRHTLRISTDSSDSFISRVKV